MFCWWNKTEWYKTQNNKEFLVLKTYQGIEKSWQRLPGNRVKTPRRSIKKRKIKDTNVSEIRTVSRIDDHKVRGWWMEKVLIGTLCNSRTLVMKLPKRGKRLHAKDWEWRYLQFCNLQSCGEPAGSGVNFQSNMADWANVEPLLLNHLENAV